MGSKLVTHRWPASIASSQDWHYFLGNPQSDWKTASIEAIKSEFYYSLFPLPEDK
jgi:hypothetical protein